MTSVLGIDPAWTLGEPSGVCLLDQHMNGWRVVGMAPSYEQFIGLAADRSMNWSERPKGSRPEPHRLLSAARALLGGSREPSLVVADIPLSRQPIDGRRLSDNLVSAEFGGMGCAAHSPNGNRPGPISEAIRDGFAREGFILHMQGPYKDGDRFLLETYPHPALVALMEANYRIPYKVSKSLRYWPDLDATERRRKLACQLRAIVTRLQEKAILADITIPDNSGPLNALKRYEDVVDALVCAWIGTLFVDGAIYPRGDEDSAIWLP